MTLRLPSGIVLPALLLTLCLVLYSSQSAAGRFDSPIAEASKKKCPKGKVRKAGKCVKRGGGKGGGGPRVRPGSYTCFDAGGTLYIHGGTYDINQGKDYPYTYSPSTNIINFPTGDYKDFYGVWESGSHDIEIRANYKDEYTEFGDYLWTCGD